MRGYKLVRPNMKSLFAEGKYRLSYEIGKITHEMPGTVGIMVFDTIENAMSFYTLSFWSSSMSLLTVRYYKRYVKPSVRICCSILESLYNDYYSSTLSRQLMREPPTGTILCSRVKTISIK